MPTPYRDANPLALSPDTLWQVAGIAERAGQAILGHYAQEFEVSRKADHSPLTEADRDAHAVIVRALEALDPRTPVLSEEGRIPPHDERRAWRRFWLVDPLDGTKEFISRNGEFTVNIALIDDGVPVLGVVHVPALGETYAAGATLGAWRRAGGQPPVRIVSRPPEPGCPLRVVESRSHPSPELERYLATIRVGRRIQLGSALKFCRLAEGEADLYPRLGPTMEWDVAAGDCLFRYATDADQPHYSPLRYNTVDLRNGGFVLGYPPVPAGVLWFTGLSGSGKSTIARELCAELARRGARVEHLDGDEIRALFPNTGYSRDEREEHIRRVGFTASRLAYHGVTVVVTLVSPYRESRAFVRELCANFLEVYVATPLDECERRDPKGLYRRARRGEVPHFTGIGDPYEPPEAAEVVLDTLALGPEAAAARVIDRLMQGTSGDPERSTES